MGLVRCVASLAVLISAVALGGACGTGADPSSVVAPADGTSPAMPVPSAPGSSARGPSAAPPPDASAPEDDTPWSAGLEQCGNEIDDDGDGLADEDCAPSFFVGVFPPEGGADLAGGGHVAKMEADLARPLSVIQTYRATNARGAARAKTELAEIWAHGAVAHLYFEPAGYTAAQYANAATDPTLDADLYGTAEAVADALAAHPAGRLFISFGAEMNGTWTDWGCKNASAATFVAVTRKLHAAVAAALVARAVDSRRLRWVYAPNSTSSGGCGGPAAYYPGHDAVDLLGMSAYRSGTESVDVAVIAPTKKLMTDLAYPSTWQRDRFIVLQTGSRTIAGDDRGAWLTSLVEKLAADVVYAGVIPFDLSDADPSRDWALLSTAKPPVARSGYDAFIAAARAVPAADARLEGIFDPYFWDVRVGDASYAEIQALRGAHVTSGCSAAPPLFCPSVAITRGEAAALLGGAFHVSAEDAAGRIAAASPCAAGAACGAQPIRRDVLAAAIGALLKLKRPLAHGDLVRLQAEALVEPMRNATRAEAASWIVHAARISPAPRP